GGPEPGIGKFLREIFQDRKRLPDLRLTVSQRRHLASAGNPGDARLEIRGIERDHLFLEGNAGGLHGDPWPKRPRGIVLVADDEMKRHRLSSPYAFGLSAGASTGPPAAFQAPNPPAIWATGARPIRCAVCAASAERWPAAQKNTNRLSAAKTGL